MKRIPALLLLCAFVTLPQFGCKKNDKGSENPDAAADGDEDGDPLVSLQAIPGEIQAEVDHVLQPITDVDVVIDQVTSIPTRYGVNAAELSGMAKAKMDGGSVSIDIEVEADAKAEIQAMLDTVGNITVGLKELPTRATTATKNIVALGAKAAGLTAKLQSKYQAKLSSPFTKAEEKAKIQGELDMVISLNADIKGTIGEAKTTVTSIPAKGGEALAKLTAALAGGASADAG